MYRATIHPAGRETYEAAVKIPHGSNDNGSTDNSGLKQEALIFSLLQHQNILRYSWPKGDFSCFHFRISIFGFNKKFTNENFFNKFSIFVKISIFGQSFDFWTNFRFLVQLSIFGQSFDFWTNFRLLVKFSIFGQQFDFWVQLSIFGQQCSMVNNEISIFSQILYILVFFCLVHAIFDQNFDFWGKCLRIRKPFEDFL